MGDVHVRNVRIGGMTTSTSSERALLWIHRELLLLGNWTEIAKDADPAWTSPSNVLLSLSDFAVTTASPNIVTSPTGGFVAATHEGFMLSLFSTDDANRGLYNIRTVIDSNTLLVDKRTRPMAWNSDESGMTGRIHKASLGLPFVGTASFFVVQAPSRNLQLHYTHNGTTALYVKAYPLGDYAGAAQATTQLTMITAESIVRLNGFFSDDASAEFMAQIYQWGSGSVYRNMTAGELFNVATGDTDPGFVQYRADWDDLQNGLIYMLNEVNAPTTFYHAYYTMDEASGESGSRQAREQNKRVNDGRFKVFNPLVVGEDTGDGGFIRGNMPRKFTYVYAPDWDEFGTDYWRMNQNSLVLRNGADDMFPMRSTAE